MLTDGPFLESALSDDHARFPRAGDDRNLGWCGYNAVSWAVNKARVL